MCFCLPCSRSPFRWVSGQFFGRRCRAKELRATPMVRHSSEVQPGVQGGAQRSGVLYATSGVTGQPKPRQEFVFAKPRPDVAPAKGSRLCRRIRASKGSSVGSGFSNIPRPTRALAIFAARERERGTCFPLPGGSNMTSATGREASG